MTISSHGRQGLFQLLAQAALFLGLSRQEQSQHVAALSLEEEIESFCNDLSLRALKIDNPESLKGNFPVLAWSRVHKKFLLLIAHENNYLAFDSYEASYGCYAKARVALDMSDFFLLTRSDYHEKSGFDFQQLKKLLPEKLSLALAFLSAFFIALALAFFVFALDYAQAENAYPLTFFSFAVFLCGLYAMRKSQTVFTKNSALCEMSLNSAIIEDYCRQSSEDFDALIEDRREREFKYLKLYFNRYLYFLPKRNLAYVILALNLLLLFVYEIKIFILFIILFFIANLISKKFLENAAQIKNKFELLYADIDKYLNAVAEAFKDIKNLKVGKGLIETLNERGKSLSRLSFRMRLARLIWQTCFLAALTLILSCVLSAVAHDQEIFLSPFLSLVLMLDLLALLWAFNCLFITEGYKSFSLILKAKTIAEKRVSLADINGRINLENISFYYPENGALILDNLNLEIKAGSFVAISGPSGAGKSTLLKLLMTEIFPKNGQIAFDGHDLRSLDLLSLRRHFGVVHQDSKLFAGTIYDNICLRRAVPKRILRNLLMSHEIYDALLDLPMGIETYIFSDEKGLSRQEKVIILLARAMLFSPRIIFLDEIFYGLSQSEKKQIMDYLNGLSLTRILIAHEDLKNWPFSQIIQLSKHN
jgi:ABC-type bacteriocin/lantibiotic exporter with double-glycine peptidase domain